MVPLTFILAASLENSTSYFLPDELTGSLILSTDSSRKREHKAGRKNSEMNTGQENNYSFIFCPWYRLMDKLTQHSSATVTAHRPRWNS